jgi:hypothetical protein
MNKHSVRALLCVVLPLIVAGIAAVPASAAPIYFQPTDLNGSYASQNDTNAFGNFATAYDNFTLSGSYTISNVQWVGSYFNPSAQAPITGFTISFYADNAGIPGALLYSTGDVGGNAGETSIGLDNAGNPAYVYGLGVSFAAAGGTTYWLSIVPDLGFPPQWGWETGTGGDGAAYQCFFGACGSVPNDLAFSLSTPEPGTVVFLATGLVALGVRVRNRML